jgi:type III restriction enzyme
VLSLFFIDAVEKYRSTTRDGNPVKGDYARSSRRNTAARAKLPDYQSLFKEVDLTTAAEEVHDGYFSIDKKSAAGPTRPRTTRQPRQRRARLQPDHEGQGEAAELRARR